MEREHFHRKCPLWIILVPEPSHLWREWETREESPRGHTHSSAILFLTSQRSTKGKYERAKSGEWSILLIQQVFLSSTQFEAQRVHLETLGTLGLSAPGAVGRTRFSIPTLERWPSLPFLNQIIAWTVPRDAELSSPLTASTPQLLLHVWVAARWEQLPKLEALWAESGSVWQTSNVTHLCQS